MIARKAVNVQAEGRRIGEPGRPWATRPELQSAVVRLYVCVKQARQELKRLPISFDEHGLVIEVPDAELNRTTVELAYDVNGMGHGPRS